MLAQNDKLICTEYSVLITYKNDYLISGCAWGHVEVANPSTPTDRSPVLLIMKPKYLYKCNNIIKSVFFRLGATPWGSHIILVFVNVQIPQGV